MKRIVAIRRCIGCENRHLSDLREVLITIGKYMTTIKKKQPAGKFKRKRGKVARSYPKGQMRRKVLRRGELGLSRSRPKQNAAKYRVLDGSLIVATGATKGIAISRAANHYRGAGLRPPTFTIQRFDQKARKWVHAGTSALKNPRYRTGKAAATRAKKRPAKSHKKNPRGKHLPGLAGKFQRMYEEILHAARKAKRYPGREKEVAARTVRKAAGKGKKHNPTAKDLYKQFRGKPVTRISAPVNAAAGTPSKVAELGKLRELKLRGRTLRFRKGRARLGGSGRRKLYIGGVRMRDRTNPGREVDMGEILGVVYEADKPHIETGSHLWRHRFGDTGGTRPHLVIDREGYPRIEGGTYTITERGIEG